MTAATNAPAHPQQIMTLLRELRAATRRGNNLTAEDQAEQAKLYAGRLSGFDVRDLAEAVREWPGDFWPDSWNLLRAAVDDAALRRRQREATQAQAPAAHRGRPAESFLGRCLRLGYDAGRVSAISYHGWQNLASEHQAGRLTDAGLVEGLRWCDENGGRVWKPEPEPATHESIRETCKLLAAVRGQPELFHAPALIALIGDELIRRHIEAGRAPTDVTDWFGPRLQKTEQAA
jgi:hypothetical protein